MKLGQLTAAEELARVLSAGWRKVLQHAVLGRGLPLLVGEGHGVHPQAVLNARPTLLNSRLRSRDTIL